MQEILSPSDSNNSISSSIFSPSYLQESASSFKKANVFLYGQAIENVHFGHVKSICQVKDSCMDLGSSS